MEGTVVIHCSYDNSVLITRFITIKMKKEKYEN